jgi:hypothetical protein
VTAFESINESASPESIEAWTVEEARAQQERAHNVTAMDIYDIKMKRCESDHFIILVVQPDRFQSLPVQKSF